MIHAGDLRPGMKVEIDGVPYVCLSSQWVKPGKGGAFSRTKLRNMKTGSIVDRTFRTEEKLQPAEIDEQEAQFLYRDSETYHFMNTETFDQFFLAAERLGEARDFLRPDMVITILFHRGETVGVQLPIAVELKVAETDPGVRGDTASGGSKPARLETGAVIQVPLFISVGDVVRVDTRTWAYLERA